jgi:hypothetical protein
VIDCLVLLVTYWMCTPVCLLSNNGHGQLVKERSGTFPVPKFPNPLPLSKPGRSLMKCVIHRFFYVRTALSWSNHHTCVSRMPCCGEMPKTVSHNPRNSDSTAVVASPWRSPIHLKSCKASWTVFC